MASEDKDYTVNPANCPVGRMALSYSKRIRSGRVAKEQMVDSMIVLEANTSSPP